MCCFCASADIELKNAGEKNMVPVMSAGLLVVRLLIVFMHISAFQNSSLLFVLGRRFLLGSCS